MNWNNIILKTNESDIGDIVRHLNECDSAFKPNLSSYVAISDYAEKLLDKAFRIELWDDSILVGLCAVYFNIEYAYITNFSILPNYQGNGFGRILIEKVECCSKERKIHIIKLEVYKHNTKAFDFYKRNGFVITVERALKIEMDLLLEH